MCAVAQQGARPAVAKSLAARPSSRAGQPGAILRTPRGNTSALEPVAQNASSPVHSTGMAAPVAVSETTASRLVNVFSEVQRLGCGEESASIASALGNISVEELEEIRRMKKPPAVVRRTIEAVCLILEAGTHPNPSSPPEWSKVQRTLERDFISRMLSFDVETLRLAPKLSRFLVQEYFTGTKGHRAGTQGKEAAKQERLTYERVFRASPPTAALFKWCCNQLGVLEEEDEEEEEGDDAEEPVMTPSITAYSTCPAIYTLGAAITDNSPINEGGPVISYSVSPCLPPGIALNSTTGVISGTPSALAEDTFLITAAGRGGEDTFALHIRIAAPAPRILRYSDSPALYTISELIEDNCPAFEGRLSRFVVSPALPNGLTIHAMTGIISGTPTALSPKTTHRIEASGPDGSSALCMLDMAVVPPVWQVLTNEGWEDDDVIQRHADMCRMMGDTPTILKYTARGFDYVVNFDRMEQFNSDMGKTRHIRKLCFGVRASPST